MLNRYMGAGLLAIALLACPAAAQDGTPLAPPTNFTAGDHPWDNGERLDLDWTASADDPGRVTEYWIYQTVANVDGQIVVPEFKLIDAVDAGTTHYEPEVKPEMMLTAVRKELASRMPEGEFKVLVDSRHHEFGVSYLYQIVAVDADGNKSEPAELSTAIQPQMQFFDLGRLSLMIVTIIFCGAVVFWINHARQGKPLNVRKIAGLEAVDEAVGRATEMGRSCLFVPGIQDINEIQTIAGITVLARVAKTAAEYDAKVEVPTSRSLVMTTARETVQAAFLAAGRPDAYNQDLIYYVTDEQFGYVAYLQGMMVREKPAACFYMGAFFAESLILAETGNSIGAIQVAGTAMPAQLPFFVAACDYTLIGEEFFAASAYLSGSPEELGSLKGQDVGKVIVAVLLMIGVIMATLAAATGSAGLQEAVTFLKDVVLS